MAETLRPMSTGELMDRTFGLYKRNFWLFVGIGSLGPASYLLFQLLTLGSASLRAGNANGVSPFSVASLGIGFAAGYFIMLGGMAIAHAATVRAVAAVHLGLQTTIIEAYKSLKGIAIAVDKKNRRLGDMVAGTVVVHEIQEQGDSYWYAQQSSSSTTISQAAIHDMTAQEFQLIETFLNRRLDLPYDQRQRTAISIADRIGVRLNVPPENRPSAETFLEELSRCYRDNARFTK